jgi:hypothetical protein
LVEILPFVVSNLSPILERAILPTMNATDSKLVKAAFGRKGVVIATISSLLLFLFVPLFLMITDCILSWCEISDDLMNYFLEAIFKIVENNSPAVSYAFACLNQFLGYGSCYKYPTLQTESVFFFLIDAHSYRNNKNEFYKLH